jgi:Endoribonuclease L-PSP
MFLSSLARARLAGGHSRARKAGPRESVTDISRWEEFGRAHRERFGEHPPATTMVEVKALIAPELLIEIEADAVAPSNPLGVRSGPPDRIAQRSC